MGVPADSLAASVHEGGHGGAHRLIPLLRGGLDPAAQDSLQGCVLGPNLDWTALDTAYSALQAGPAPLDPLSTFSCWAPAEALEVLKDTELLNAWEAVHMPTPPRSASTTRCRRPNGAGRKTRGHNTSVPPTPIAVKRIGVCHVACTARRKCDPTVRPQSATKTLQEHVDDFHGEPEIQERCRRVTTNQENYGRGLGVRCRIPAGTELVFCHCCGGRPARTARTRFRGRNTGVPAGDRWLTRGRRT